MNILLDKDALIVYGVTSFILPWVNALIMKRRWPDYFRVGVAAAMAFLVAIITTTWNGGFRDITNWGDWKNLGVAFGIVFPLSQVFYRSFKTSTVAKLEDATTKESDK